MEYKAVLSRPSVNMAANTRSAQGVCETRKGNDDEKIRDAGIGDCGRVDGSGAEETQTYADAASNFSWIADEQLRLLLQPIDVRGERRRLLERHGVRGIRTETQTVLDKIARDVSRRRICRDAQLRICSDWRSEWNGLG